MWFFCLEDSPRVVGRSPGCSIQVDDNEVSREHARFEPVEGRWQVTDCGSANGVFVNGHRVDTRLLEGGEIIRIGTTFFRFFAEGPAEEDGPVEVHTDKMVSGPGLDKPRRILTKAARGDLTLLINGETGTGKEVAALLVHQLSDRGDGPFVPVNCAAIPDNMVESELFGHVRGAFTGATTDNPGLVRQASGGTLFLDEIGELPLASQAKLLRVLQERKVRPVGGRSATAVDMRVCCATNANIGALAQQGQFRMDLFARIAELVVELPPLRDRIEDVPLLVDHFLKRHGKIKQAVMVEAMEQLCIREWPLNIRGLQSAVRRAVLMAGDESQIGPDHLFDGDPITQAMPSAVHPSTGGDTTSGNISVAQAVPGGLDPQAARLVDALTRHHGDANEAARELGISRSMLYRRAKKYGIKVGLFRP